MNRNKADYITIAFGGILLVIVFYLAYILTLQQQPAQNVGEQKTNPTSTPQRSTPSVKTGPEPVLPYDEAAEKRLIRKLISPPPLSTEDNQARSNLLQTHLKGNNSGVAYENENIRIEYISSVQYFLVEVKTIDVAKAKAEANIWFRSQGISQQGICDLPIRFMPSFDVSQQMGESGMTFNPLPNSC